MAEPAFKLCTISEDDKDRVLDFLRTFFFRDEPLVECLELLEAPDSRCPELEEYSVEAIHEENSVMAVNADGKIVGLCLNGLLTRDQHSLEPPGEELEQELERCLDPKFRKILRLLKTVYWRSNVFKSHPGVDRVLDIKIISVDTSCRCQGVARALLRQTIEVARRQQIPVLRVDCTSAYSALAVERLGFCSVLSLPYRDHRDQEGRVVFTPPTPHTAVNTFVYSVQ